MTDITYGELYRLTLNELNEITESASTEAQMLFRHCFGLDRIGITINGDKIADSKGAELLYECLEKRRQHLPIQYVVGSRSFYDFDFLVGEGVLIPRPETEMLVDGAVEFIKTEGLNAPVVYDLCSGSGCVGISIAKLVPDASVYLFEKSDLALEFIKKNIALNNTDNVTVIKYDIFDGIPQELPCPDVIVSNPPYIPTEDIAGLEKEVQREPSMALDGGADGLDFYRCICDKWLLELAKPVYFALEFGINQSIDIADIFRTVSRNAEILKDFNEIDRVVCGTTNE
ncbi:MAG: peptide chain release factor N(5)-glutamine methyltransferase [Clostridia bacterium]|nr:peptide chain release factor N(5)-glutamine methyltransferase [Clostridia bacterium]